MKPHMKDNGLKVKKKVRVKSYSKVEVFSKETLKMMLNKDMEKCIIILQEIILKVNGQTIKNKVEELWIGQILEKNMSVNGEIIINKVGECIFGLNPKVKENIWETDMKVIGLMESDKDMVYFTMQMDQNIKVIGKIIWSKVTHFIPIKMEEPN